MVIHKQYEFVKHRKYASGNVQWRCKLYQSSKCQARLTTKNDEIVSNCDPEHNHSGNKENILARQAVVEMKDKMSHISATPSAVIASVVTQLEPDVLMALPKKQTLKRTLNRKRQKLQSESGANLPPLPIDMSFTFPDQFQDLILFDSGSGSDRLILLRKRELLDGLARAKLWLADGTFKVVPSLFFQLYTMHFELVPGINSAAVYCLVQNKTQAVYVRILDVIKRMIPLANPEKILLDFGNAAINAFTAAYPNARILGCYFHLTQSILRKVNNIGMKSDYESDDNLRIAVRCLPALAMVPSTDVAEAFWILADYMPEHEKMPELLAYFEHTYIRGRRRPGRNECYRSAIYPIETWNHFESASEGIARTTNSIEGWHYGLQALLQCHHPTLWTFIKGLEKDMQMQHATFVQGVSGLQPFVPKRYQSVKLRVANAVARYSRSEILVYWRGIAYLSHK